MPTDHRFWWSQGVNVSLTPPNAPDSAQYISLTLRAAGLRRRERPIQHTRL
ncbi:MAG: hypothetical protein ABI874_04300 [Chloroflexota bacterium]